MTFEIKDDVSVEGISSDYVWYHAKVLTTKMQTWGFEFERITKVMEDRHNEHLKIISDLLAENKELKEKLRDRPDTSNN